MERRASARLGKWLFSKRRKPLVLRGARQVGKSTLVRQLAADHGLTLCEVNLERHLSLEKTFASLDMGAIRGELEALAGRSLDAPHTLVFLDEIQATPSALQALRYFYEDMPNTPVIAAGSLLEFALADHTFSMPVGRIEYHHLGPMTFGEYLRAIAPEMCRYLSTLDFGSPLPEAAHEKLCSHYRRFLFVGGMPEAVDVFRESGSIDDAASVQRSIVSTYEDDFTKYAKRVDLALLQGVFRQIPLQVGRKVKYVNFSRDDPSRTVKSAVDLLAKARVCCQVFASHCSGVPLYADIDPAVYKLLYLDVGLMNHVCGMDWIALQGRDPVQLVNEGAVAEQFVGQHLAYPDEGTSPPRPVYWLREGRSANAEVDYVVSRGNVICPVEVKAGKAGTLRSLHQFVEAKGVGAAVRFDMNPPSATTVEVPVRTRIGTSTVTYDLLSLPLYAIGELDRLLDAYRAGN